MVSVTRVEVYVHSVQTVTKLLCGDSTAPHLFLFSLFSPSFLGGPHSYSFCLSPLCSNVWTPLSLSHSLRLCLSLSLSAFLVYFLSSLSIPVHRVFPATSTFSPAWILTPHTRLFFFFFLLGIFLNHLSSCRSFFLVVSSDSLHERAHLAKSSQHLQKGWHGRPNLSLLEPCKRFFFFFLFNRGPLPQTLQTFTYNRERYGERCLTVLSRCSVDT